MALRLKALLMLVVVGLILPVAGTPQRFCARFQAWLVPGMTCPACVDDGTCDCEPPTPELPGCVMVAKMLPDGISADALALPAPITLELPPETLPTPVWIMTGSRAGTPSRERAPPRAVPLFLRNRALLL